MLKQEEQVAGILEETHSKNAAQSSSVGQKQAASLCTLLGSGNLLEAYSSPLHFILYGILLCSHPMFGLQKRSASLDESQWVPFFSFISQAAAEEEGCVDARSIADTL